MNILLPALGALLFGGLVGLSFRVLSAWGNWQAARFGMRIFASWMVVVVLASVTAAVWAVGATIAQSDPTGAAWAFRTTQPDLLASGDFGVVWGWLPALIFARFAATSDSVGPTRPWSRALVALSAALTVVAAVAIIVAQPAVVRAERIAAGGSPNGLPTSVPSATPATAAPPPIFASDPVRPDPGWCTPENTSLTASPTQSALGHRAIGLVLVNLGTATCVVDGYPDAAFAMSGGSALVVTVQRGSSYTAADPGPTAITLPVGGAVSAQLGWDPSGARTNTATMLWAAEYPGAERTQLPIDTDIVTGSTVYVTAWSLIGNREH
jgi:hypothetical protein